MDAGRRIDLSGFIKELDAFTEEEIPRIVDQTVRSEAFGMVHEYVLAVPVGNPELWAEGPESAPEGYVGGHARRNWQVTANEPATEELPGVDADGGTTLAAAAAVLEKLDPYPLVFISNPVPYMDPLNEGHSTQVPAGWIDDIFDRRAERFAVANVEPEPGGPE